MQGKGPSKPFTVGRASAAVRGVAPLLAASLAVACFPARATLGIYEHGNGLVSLGMGGVAYSHAEETTALAANPAHAIALGMRLDLGIDGFAPAIVGSIDGNAAGPNERDRTVHRIYTIPQGGFALPLSPHWALGFTITSAGLGPDYQKSPYQPFGGAQRTTLALQSSSVVSALAWRPLPGQDFGVGIITGYQGLEVRGVQFLAGLSDRPDAVSDRGRDGALTIGFNLGWHGQLLPWLSAGAAYRSQNWTQRAHRYEGLLPEHGQLDLPAIWGGGFDIVPAPRWHLALEFQRYEYTDQAAFANRIGALSQGKLLGTDDGPGFGLNDQNVYKLGVSWAATPQLTLRGGYIRGSQVMNNSETLFGFLGCIMPTTHYTAGATWRQQRWDFTGTGYFVPRKIIHGENSIPAAFGGGEATVSGLEIGGGFSLAYRFGERRP